MAKIDDKWNRVLKKIQLILEKNKKLEATELQLKNKISELNQEILNLNKQKEQLKEENKLIKATKEVRLSEKERVDTKKQIKAMIDEIDECLTNITI